MGNVINPDSSVVPCFVNLQRGGMCVYSSKSAKALVVLRINVSETYVR